MTESMIEELYSKRIRNSLSKIESQEKIYHLNNYKFTISQKI